MSDLEKQKFPVGRFARLKTPLDPATRAAHIATLEAAPAQYRSLAAGLSEAQLDTPYREGGWTVRQVVHHVPDSHMTAYIRMKLAVTEDAPAVRGYQEELWAELPEAKSGPVAMSLDLLNALHGRWVAFLRGLPVEAFQKTYVHSDMGPVTLDEALSLYAWHCRHHAAHISSTLTRSAATS